MGLTKEQFEHYYPNEDFNKRHEIGEVMTRVIAASDDLENVQTVPTAIPVEQAIKNKLINMFQIMEQNNLLMKLMIRLILLLLMLMNL